MLIFIYPVWAFGMPAILHGFLSKVFTPGFAFEEDRTKKPLGLLSNNSIVFMTTGAPKSYYELTGNTPIQLIKSCLKYCGMQPSIFQLGNCKKVNDAKIAEIQMMVNKAFNP